ncbi:hypothetical protein JCGZ_02951 [Jatropha curcas]|uniref:Pentacotripeptide-repeat region of PRORP domain-containing protein n=2 Tax=Jatropha curcas TaxID=180498 RepID=A0A067L1A9_JATCU|nr:hypothetical protein JCGZ_02951 [Jatropha curcas]
MHILIRAPTFYKLHFKIPIIHNCFRSCSDLYSELIQIYTREQALQQGKILHAHLITSGLAHSTHFASKLISLYAETKQLYYARKLFDDIPKPNIHCWVVLVGAYSRRGYYQEALDAFFEMQNEGLKPDKFVIPSVLKACGHLFDLQNGKTLHSVILRYLFDSDVFVITALIDMYCRCRQVGKARRVFDGMEEKDLVALNAMVLGYAQNGLAKEGFNLVEKMKIFDIRPNIVTWNTLISGFAQAGEEEMVSKVFELMLINGVEPDVFSWTSIISGLVKNFKNEAAFDTFKKMSDSGFYPSYATISSILPACASMGNVRLGRELHGYAVVIGVENDIYVSSALVDMYAKCGFISEGRTLFYKMPVKNTATWNSMIFGYANHGYCSEAIDLFNQMEGKKLDYLSFVAVLTACSHGGMVELGKSLFLLMQEKYKIVPRLEHYACMVDLLGRAGKLSEAYDTIKTMPIEPDLFVWGALLGACRHHGDIELAEIAAKHLAELEPDNAGNDMLLSNLYADAGSWENVARFKKMMKRKKLRKFSGCSWIDS